MAKRLLIDASRPDESRVVVLNGERVEDADFETQAVKLIKGNIYLARVMRVEPSLQAAFVDYGGNRHGFLSLAEIHPDYFQIPVADREALVEEVEAEVESWRARRRPQSTGSTKKGPSPAAETASGPAPQSAADTGAAEQNGDADALLPASEVASLVNQLDKGQEESEPAAPQPAQSAAVTDSQALYSDYSEGEDAGGLRDEVLDSDDLDRSDLDNTDLDSSDPDSPQGEGEGGDSDSSNGDADFSEEAFRTRAMTRAILSRRYRIQTVIKRRQVMLVQVGKEERGMKGAALTTYLSLAGRYCVLMPNSSSGGGVSRRIPSLKDRRRLKTILRDLPSPAGMSLIVRTAGAQRTKLEIKRDFEFLLREWDEIRTRTLKSEAPQLIHEEASLIKRAVRDIYRRDMDEIWIEGQDAYKAAKALMKTLTPSHAAKVKLHKSGGVPLFQHYRVESQLETLNAPTVSLKSGGYIVLNQTEALVAVDVNSGKSTSERSIEDTALRTNLEAADEIARQLRLRDLAGLIVIDFIDMEESSHNSKVEQALKEAMRGDRARIQLGSISNFGLLELSRQRLRPSFAEVTMQPCRFCHGTGLMRSGPAEARGILRHIEAFMLRQENGIAEVEVRCATEVMTILLNDMRDEITRLETQHSCRLRVLAAFEFHPSAYAITLVDANGNRHEDKGEQDALESTSDSGESSSSQRRRRGNNKGGNKSEGSAESDKASDSKSAAEPSRQRTRAGRKRANGASSESAASSPADKGGTEDAVVSGALNGRPESVPASEAQAEDADGRDEGNKKRRRRGKRGGRRRNKSGAEANEASPNEIVVESLFTEPTEPAPENLPAQSAATAEPEKQPNSAAQPFESAEDAITDTLPLQPEPSSAQPDAQPIVADTMPETDSARQPFESAEGIESAALQPEPGSAQPDSQPVVASAMPEASESRETAPTAKKRRGWWQLGN